MHLINRSQLSIKIIMPLFKIFRGRLNWSRINANYKRITKNQPSRTISSQESRQIGKITQSVGWSMDWCWKWPYRILRKGFSLESFLLFEYLKSKNIFWKRYLKYFEILWFLRPQIARKVSNSIASGRENIQAKYLAL